MDRLKTFGIWILIIIAFYLYSQGIIYMYYHGTEIGLKLYELTHKEQVVNELQDNEAFQ